MSLVNSLIPRRRPAARRPISAAELGLERFPQRGVFVQFSSPGSLHCRVALNRLAAAVAVCPGEAALVEMQLGRGDRLAGRLGVHLTPTVMHLDQEGAVTRRWTRPPDPAELHAALC